MASTHDRSSASTLAATPTTAPTTPQPTPKPTPPAAQISGGSEASNYDPSEDSDAKHKAPAPIPRRAPMPIPWKYHGKTSADHIAAALAAQPRNDPPPEKGERVYTGSTGSTNAATRKPKMVKATASTVSCSWQVLKWKLGAAILAVKHRENGVQCLHARDEIIRKEQQRLYEKPDRRANLERERELIKAGQ